MKKKWLLAAASAALGAAGYAAAQGYSKLGTGDIAAQSALSDVLRSAQNSGAAVVVNLEGGFHYDGKVADVSNAAVVVNQVKGKESFDIYIPLNRISSAEIQLGEKEKEDE